jgi:hypothetical protein
LLGVAGVGVDGVGDLEVALDLAVLQFGLGVAVAAEVAANEVLAARIDGIAVARVLAFQIASLRSLPGCSTWRGRSAARAPS